MKRPPGVCKDCWADHQVQLEVDPSTKEPRWRPAPYPGPRCATDHRAAQRRQEARAHDRKVQVTFDLEPGEYDRLLAFQGGHCAICQRATGKTKRLAVDHDHGNGQVRGLLCGPCNQLLGHGRDDPEFFRRIIGYLTMPPYIEMLWLDAAAEAHCPPTCQFRHSRHTHGAKLYEPLQGGAQGEQLNRDTGTGSVEQQLRPVRRDRPDPAAVDPVARQ